MTTSNYEVLKEFEIIKKYYKPIQPTVKAEDTEVIYRESRPASEIENFIYCFWQLKTQKPLKNPYTYRVVSDGCIDIFFDNLRPSRNFVMGFCRKCTDFSLGEQFDYMGIRFLPSAFPILFGVNAKVLSNKSQDLRTILPNFSSWMESMAPSLSFEVVTGHLNKELIEVSKNPKGHYDLRVLNSLDKIFQNKGFLNTEQDLKTGLCPRQLRRVFNHYIGTTAKAFSNVVRFQYVLNARLSLQGHREDRIYLDVGFFDQAHFIKSFKTFYGVTPGRAFK